MHVDFFCHFSKICWAFVSPSSPLHCLPPKKAVILNALRGVQECVGRGSVNLVCTSLCISLVLQSIKGMWKADKARPVLDVCLSDNWSCSAVFEAWVVGSLVPCFQCEFVEDTWQNVSGPSCFLQGMKTALQTWMSNVLVLPHSHFQTYGWNHWNKQVFPPLNMWLTSYFFFKSISAEEKQPFWLAWKFLRGIWEGEKPGRPPLEGK